MAVTIRGSGQLVVQVVQTVKTSVFTSTTSLPSFIDVTGASATITPTSASNKILVTVSGAVSNSSATYSAAINLVRGSTSILVGDARGSATSCSQGFNPSTAVISGNISLCYLDSPATTSATTYKLQLGTESIGTACIGGTGLSASAAYLNIPTIITLQEIAYA
jgi:hypothetical protein